MESDKFTVDTTNESQEVSPFPAGDHKANINRRAQSHSKHKTEQKHKRSTKDVLKSYLTGVCYDLNETEGELRVR